MIKSAHKKTGFSLLELLLAVTLLSLLLLGVYQILDSWLQRAVNRQAAEDIVRVKTAAVSYITSNYPDVCPAVSANYDRLDLSLLQTAGFLNTTTPRTAHRQAIEVYVQCMDAVGTNPASANVLVITTGDRLAENEVLDTAFSIGAEFGTLTALSPDTVQSINNSWSVPRTLLTGYTATATDADGGYIATYTKINDPNATNANILYRTEIPGNPSLNALQTNLNMNNNDLNDVSTMTAATLSVDPGRTTTINSGAGATALTVGNYLGVWGTGGLTAQSVNGIGVGIKATNTLRATAGNISMGSNKVNVGGTTKLADSGAGNFTTLNNTGTTNFAGEINANILELRGTNNLPTAKLLANNMTGNGSLAPNKLVVGTLDSVNFNNVNNLDIAQSPTSTVNITTGLTVRNVATAAKNPAITTAPLGRVFLNSVTCKTGATELAPQCRTYTP